MRTAGWLTLLVVLTACSGTPDGPSESASGPGASGDADSTFSDCPLNAITLATDAVTIESPDALRIEEPGFLSGEPWPTAIIDADDSTVLESLLGFEGDLESSIESAEAVAAEARLEADGSLTALVRRNIAGSFWVGALAFDDDRVLALDCGLEWVDITESFRVAAEELGEEDLVEALRRVVRSDHSSVDERFSRAWPDPNTPS